MDLKYCRSRIWVTDTPLEMSSCCHAAIVGRSGARKATWCTVPPACSPRFLTPASTSTSAPDGPPGHADPGPVALLAGEGHPEQVRQHRGRRVQLPLRQGDRVQAAYRVLG